jgi:HK97 family phage portal protein
MADNIFKRVYKAIVPEKRKLTYETTTAVGLPYSYSSVALSELISMQLSAVYRCVEVVTDAIASQSWDILEYSKIEGFVSNPFHYAAYLLNNEPCPSMTRYTLMKTLVAKMLLEGNGYCIIRRNGRGDPIRLDLVCDETVKMFMGDDRTIWYEVGYEGKTERIEGYDMIHLLNFSYNGLVGVSTLQHAANSMGLAYASESSAKGFFTSGANMSGILTAEGKMTKEKATALKASWAEAFNVTSGNPGGIAVMESGLEFKPVTVNPRDAQMLETRQFNVIEICRFFGVHPSKVFDQSNLTYSNIESFQLGFLTDTISPLDAKIEAEFNRKLLRPSERIRTKLNLSIEELLRANMDAKANYVSKMFQCGGFSVNEVRKECGNPKSDSDNADKPMIQINMQSIEAFSNKPKQVDKNTNLVEEQPVEEKKSKKVKAKVNE